MRRTTVLIWLVIATACSGSEHPQVSQAGLTVEDFSGEYYFVAGQQCGTITLDEAGRVHPLDSGFCDFGSEVECSENGCRFTCRNYNATGSSMVFRAATAEPSGGILQGPMVELWQRTGREPRATVDAEADDPVSKYLREAPDARLFSSQADCETMVFLSRRVNEGR